MVKPQDLSNEPFSEHHRQDLAASGIPEDLARRVGLRSASEQEVQQVLGRAKPVGPGLIIPYPDPDTKQPLHITVGGASVPFVRVRLDDPSKAPDRDGKPSKYLSRRGAGQYPYFISEVVDMIAGVQRIILVEGEKKALSAYAAGLPAIDLAGNFGWTGKDANELHPLLTKGPLRNNM